MAQIAGIPVVYGIPKTMRPLVIPMSIGEPLKIRYRFRNTDAGRVFVKTARGLHSFIIRITGNGTINDPDAVWTCVEQGENSKPDKFKTAPYRTKIFPAINWTGESLWQSFSRLGQNPLTG